MSTCEKLRAKLTQLLKKFSLQEFSILLDESIINIPPEIINETLSKFMLRPTSSSVAEVCSHFIKRGKLKEDVLESLIHKVYAWDVALHRSQNTRWCAVLMDQEVSELPETFEDLNSIIAEAYNESDIGMSVKVFSVYVNHIVWTVVFPKVKLKNGHLRDKAPIMFAYKPTLEPPHFLFSPPTLDPVDLHFSLYTGALGYEGHHVLEYKGIDPVGMLDCIEKKYQYVDHLPVSLPMFNGGNAVVKSRGEGIYDYSYAEERKELADQIFQTKTRQYFKVVCDGTLVDETKINSSKNTTEEMNFYSTLEFRAYGKKTAEEMLHYLVSIGAVTIPVPDYMLKVSSMPTNVITIHQQTHLPPSNALALK